jgi:hypothetical protein
MTGRRFPPPWQIVEHVESFWVQDASDRRGDGCGEGQAESVAPGPAAPASPMRFSGERTFQPGGVSGASVGAASGE